MGYSGGGGVILEGDVPAEIARDSEVTTSVGNHEADTTNVHGIPNTANLETTAGAQAKVDAHVNDATAAHAASAVAFTPTGTVASTDVQAAIAEVATEAVGVTDHGLLTGLGDDDHPQYVKDTGDETIAGIKTFSSIPLGPASNPMTDNQLARKKYVDDLVVSPLFVRKTVDESANDGNAVYHPDSALTLAVAANKTYTFEVWALMTGASGDHIKVGFNVPASPTAFHFSPVGAFYEFYDATGASGAKGPRVVDGTTGGLGYMLGSSSSQLDTVPGGVGRILVHLRGLLVNGSNAGNLVFKWYARSWSGNSGYSATCYAGSWMSALRMN